jgi:hypothetical protein
MQDRGPQENHGLLFLESILAGMIGSLAVIALLNLGKVLRWVDGFFEHSPTEPTVVPADDLSDLGGSGFSATDYRNETELLRALKEQLDADAEAARATIRRERAQAAGQQTGKD